ESISSLTYLAYNDENSRIAFAILAGVVFIMNYLFYSLFTINVHRDKTIAFDNPEGRVSVSLAALEDLVKRTIHSVEEIKDGKSNIVASKKGLHVKIRLSIRSDVSIPEMSSQVQELVKDKIQDTIGIDEKVDIAVYISKIIAESTLKTRKKEGVVKKSKEDKNKGEDQEPQVPFQGYLA
ncbi:MAG: putative alkaline shock family protein YloU, partial [Candidatus Omnitrophota bacterium]